MKFGITGDYSKIAIYRAGLSSNFQKYASEDLISSDLKDNINEAKNRGFINKGISKKTQAFKNNLFKIKQDNYKGKWYESGWYEKNPVEKTFFHYPTNGAVIYKKTALPYTNETSTGVYINLNWSGLKKYFDNENFVVGGYVDASISYLNEIEIASGSASDFPYRNVNEIFDHKNIQVGDMGKNKFILPEFNHPTGSQIGYNEIYFESGLNRANINENTKILIFPSTKLQTNVNYRRHLDGKRFKYQEKLNEPRYYIFFYN